VRNILNNEVIHLIIAKTKKFVSWIELLQCRKDEDFLATHKDRYKFQSILMRSEKGKDFSTVGEYFLHETRLVVLILNFIYFYIFNLIYKKCFQVLKLDGFKLTQIKHLLWLKCPLIITAV
jgi:hypothetical protein